MVLANTYEKFVKQAREIHGDKYQYPESGWIGWSKKNQIHCPEHNYDFYHTAWDHLKRKAGCGHCSGNLSPTNEMFLQKLQEKYQNQNLDFSETVYTNRKSPVIAACSEHGRFTSSADRLLSGRTTYACQKCSMESYAEKNSLTRESALEQYQAQFGDTLDFSQCIVPARAKKGITKNVICGLHGAFDKSHSELIRGNGCSYCTSYFAKNHEDLMPYFDYDKNDFDPIFAGASKSAHFIKPCGHTYYGPPAAFRTSINARSCSDCRSENALCNETTEQLLQRAADLYQQHGLNSFNKTWQQENGHASLFTYLYSRKYGGKKIAQHLGVDLEELHQFTWKAAIENRGHTFFESWEDFVDYVRPLVEDRTELPTQDWFNENGYAEIPRALYSKFGKTINDLSAEFDHFVSDINQFICKAGLRHRSFAEVQVSDFLYKYGADYRSEPRYPEDFSTQHTDGGRFDFGLTIDQEQFFIEVWGSNYGRNQQRYDSIRSEKEKYCQENNINLIGIEYADTLSEDKLKNIFEPYLSNVKNEIVVNSIILSFEERVVEDCRQLAAQQPDGLLPSEEWIRKRGRWKDREGDAYGTLPNEIRAIGGFLKVRQILGEELQYRDWDDDKILEELRDFYDTHQITPTKYISQHRLGGENMTTEVSNRATRLVGAMDRSDTSVQSFYTQVGIDKTEFRASWTDEQLIEEVQKFIDTHGKFPNTYYSGWNRKGVGDYETAKWAGRLQSAMRRTENLRTKEAMQSHLNLEHLK